MIDPAQFERLMRGLTSATGKTFSADAIEFWHLCFADMSPTLAQAGFAKFCQSGDPWPTVAKIRTLAVEHDVGQRISAGDAFELALDAVRRYGLYKPVKGRASLDDLTRRAVSQLGGWLWMCDCSADNRHVMSSQFRRVYEALVDREREFGLLPEALRPRITNDAPMLAAVPGLRNIGNIPVDES